jgi:hypothetical protein
MSGGARHMIEEGIFERFAIASVFGLHNTPGTAVRPDRDDARPADGIRRRVRDHRAWPRRPCGLPP